MSWIGCWSRCGREVSGGLLGFCAEGFADLFDEEFDLEGFEEDGLEPFL